jgi:HTH-type transcriptional regulator/antitoxin HipB
MDSKEVADKVRYFRKQSGLSQRQLAQLAGIGKTAVFDIEKGKKTVRLDTLLKVFSVLNIQLILQTPFPYPMEHK